MTKRKIKTSLYLIAGLTFCLAVRAEAETVHDTLFRVYSKLTPRSVVSRSLAGSGSAMPHSDFQGFINPALTMTGNGGRAGGAGTMAMGYGWDEVFDKVILPFGMVFIDNNGAMGVYYSYLNGERSTVHDAMLNFSWEMFKQAEKPGSVDGGLNIRYERSKWRHRIEGGGVDDGENGEESPDRIVNVNASNLILDLGFYQRQILPGIDFAFVFTNLAGYRWNNTIDGGDKASGWFGWRHCSMVAGMLYTFPMWGAIVRIPFDVEMTGLFSKASPSSYIMRTGIEAQIAQIYSVRFGYARSPGSFADLIADFHYKNLYYGGVGINVRPVKFDFFIGTDEFGATATYFY
ncbi:MAG: hypothetical protein LBC70_07415 [Chitinispirillales bacterium]|jgi:hypothetical protein|nr:hypothetical protein [Chitinispirillales bacterium]